MRTGPDTLEQHVHAEIQCRDAGRSFFKFRELFPVADLYRKGTACRNDADELYLGRIRPGGDIEFRAGKVDDAFLKPRTADGTFFIMEHLPPLCLVHVSRQFGTILQFSFPVQSVEGQKRSAGLVRHHLHMFGHLGGKSTVIRLILMREVRVDLPVSRKTPMLEEILTHRIERRIVKVLAPECQIVEFPEGRIILSEQMLLCQGDGLCLSLPALLVHASHGCPPFHRLKASSPLSL